MATYQDVARLAGNPKAWRAVGAAMKNNPDKSVAPCHRVVGSDGSMHGYAFGGEQAKIELLKYEGVTFVGDTVDLHASRWDGEAEESPEALLSSIAEHFPQLKWSSYKYLDEGWDHEVIILDDKLVFRFPDDDEYIELLQNEIKILRRIQPLVSVKIPVYSHIAPDKSFAGYPMIAGKQLTKTLFDTLPAAERTNIAVQIAGFLSVLHAMAQNGHDVSGISPSHVQSGQAELKQQAELYLRGVLNEQDYSVAQKIISEVDELLTRPLPTVFLHGDLYNRHLLWDSPKAQLGVIDFSDMNLGDPAYDFAELYEYGSDFVREVYEYYTAPKDDTFLRRAWTYQRWVAVVMIIDHFINYKTSFQEARETFDRVKV